MDPRSVTRRSRSPPAPRARGDGPSRQRTKLAPLLCSPRTRGWTLPCQQSLVGLQLLPAHAGMDPPPRGNGCGKRSAPRARGDGPKVWAPKKAGDGCSPRTRGWTLRDPGDEGPVILLPAHAGMDPGGSFRGCYSPAAPRARGDGPAWRMRPGSCRSCSPRTRGWTHELEHLWLRFPLLPAHAGMDPPPVPWSAGSSSAPRARGDGPHGPGRGASFDDCSLRTRGWTLGDEVLELHAALLPAHAGMDP